MEFIKAMRQRLNYTGPGSALKDAFARLAGSDGKIVGASGLQPTAFLRLRQRLAAAARSEGRAFELLFSQDCDEVFEFVTGRKNLMTSKKGMSQEELDSLRLVAPEDEAEEEEEEEEDAEAAGAVSSGAAAGRPPPPPLPEEWSTDTLRTAMQAMCIRHKISPLALMKAWDRDGNGSLSQNEVRATDAPLTG